MGQQRSGLCGACDWIHWCAGALVLWQEVEREESVCGWERVVIDTDRVELQSMSMHWALVAHTTDRTSRRRRHSDTDNPKAHRSVWFHRPLYEGKTTH